MPFRVLVPLFLLHFAGSIHAQSIQWNTRGGIHFSTARIIDKKDGHQTKTNAISGGSASIGLKIEFDKRLYFAPRLQYSMTGYKKPGDQMHPDSIFRLHYLEIPILLHLSLGKTETRGLFTEFGLALGGAFSGRVKQENQSTPLKFSMTQYNPVNVNALGTLGYLFRNGLMLEAVYTYGLTSITNGDTKPKIRTFQTGITLGYNFSGKQAQK